MLARLICFVVVATILAAFTSAEEQNLRAEKPSIAFPQGSALKFADAMIRKLSNNAVGIDSTSAFRDPAGQLQNVEPSINYADASPDLAALSPCPTNPNAGTSIYYGAGSFGALAFTYAVPLPTLASPYTSISENFCLTLSGSLSALNMNFNTATQNAVTQSIAMQGISGTTCNNCYAYVGATIALGLSCSASVGVSTSVTCTVAFDTSGATKFNMDFEMTNPSMSTNGPLTALYTQTTPTNLYNDPTTGIYVNANPSLYYQFQGSISTTGTASIVAGFSTTAGFSIQATAGTTNTVSLTGFADATLTLPTVTSTLKLQSIALSVVVNPTVSWVLGIGCGSGTTSSVCVTTGSSETGVGFSVVIVTPFTATYNWQQTSATASPTSSLLLTAQANLQNIILDAEFTATTPVPACTTTGIISYTDVVVPAQTCITVLSNPVQSPTFKIYQAPGTQSLGAAAVPVTLTPTASPTSKAGTPTPAPTTGTGSGGGGSTSSKGSSGDNNNLDGGAITGIVIATLVVACGIAFAVYHFYFKGKISMASGDEKKTTANPVHKVELA